MLENINYWTHYYEENMFYYIFVVFYRYLYYKILSNIYLNNIRIKFVYIFKIIFVHIKYEI